MTLQRIVFTARSTTDQRVATFLFGNPVVDSAVTTASIDEETTFQLCPGCEASWRLFPQGSMEVLRIQREVSTSAADPRAFAESDFRRLAKSSPRQLVWLIRHGNLRAPQLTFAAEIAGSIPDSAVVEPVLLDLLDHPSPLVREGAIYGLSRHLSKEVRRQLARVSETDPSPAVRSAARDAIE